MSQKNQNLAKRLDPLLFNLFSDIQSISSEISQPLQPSLISLHKKHTKKNYYYIHTKAKVQGQNYVFPLPAIEHTFQQVDFWSSDST
jgi:hypothetical protein